MSRGRARALVRGGAPALARFAGRLMCSNCGARQMRVLTYYLEIVRRLNPRKLRPLYEEARLLGAVGLFRFPALFTGCLRSYHWRRCFCRYRTQVPRLHQSKQPRQRDTRGRRPQIGVFDSCRFSRRQGAIWIRVSKCAGYKQSSDGKRSANSAHSFIQNTSTKV